MITPGENPIIGLKHPVMSIKQQLQQTDWPAILDHIDHKGYGTIPGVLDQFQCKSLIQQYDDQFLYHKTINMARYRFGEGQYKYFSYPLPGLISQMREFIYTYLAPLANHWMRRLNQSPVFPGNFDEFIRQCHQRGQVKPTPLILKYEKGGYNTLHQDLYGEIYFPLQAIVSLNQPNQDYTGGELMLTEQRPRAQSKGIVLRPNLGDLAIISTNFRPVKGGKGYYRVNMKHGVSEVLWGNRYTLGIIFHDGQ